MCIRTETFSNIDTVLTVLFFYFVIGKKKTAKKKKEKKKIIMAHFTKYHTGFMQISSLK